MEIEKITGEGATVKLNPEDLGVLALGFAHVEGQEAMAETFKNLSAKVEMAKSTEENNKTYHDNIRNEWDIRQASKGRMRERAVHHFPDAPPVRFE